MHYYGTRLSDNLSFREPEGYLLCLNVPVEFRIIVCGRE